MPYLPETDELLLNDEEAYWISNHPERWAEMVEHEFKNPSSAPVFLNFRLQTCLTHYRERWYYPATPYGVIKCDLYRRIGVSCQWDATTKSYLPVSVQGIRKGCKNPKQIGTATDLNIRFADDRTYKEVQRPILHGETRWLPA